MEEAYPGAQGLLPHWVLEHGFRVQTAAGGGETATKPTLWKEGDLAVDLSLRLLDSLGHRRNWLQWPQVKLTCWDLGQSPALGNVVRAG